MTTPYATEVFLRQILGKAVSAGASDVHLKVGQPPGGRVRGDLVFFKVDRLRAEDTAAAARLLLGADAAARLEGPAEIVRPYEAPGLGRFRVSAFRQRGALSLVLRSIPTEIPALATLGLPAAATSLVEADRGLVLFSGGAGAGKSTTAAALVAHLTTASPLHVVTLEDPIEHLHEDRRGSVSQRAVGADVPSIADGLRAALRHDADILYASDLPTPAALDAALDAAELGHLVLAAVAAPDVAHAIARLSLLGRTVPSFAARFAASLHGALAQRLLPKRDGSGLVPACEVLVATAAMRDTIRAGCDDGAALPGALANLMERGASAHGMQTFEMHVQELTAQGVIGRAAGGPPSGSAAG